MKKNLLVFFAFGFFALFSVYKPVLADYSQAYNNYQYQYNLYRQDYENFTIAKATYLTYQTLTTQNDLLEKMRTVLLSRNRVMISYLATLSQKAMIADGLAPNDLATTQRIIGEETTFLSSLQNQISAAATISDLNTINTTFADHYQQLDTEAKQIVGQILLGKTDYEDSKFADLTARSKLQVQRLSNLGEDTQSLSRGITAAESKAALYDDKRSAAVEVLYPKNNFNFQKIDLLAGQKLILDGRQYLHEAGSFLLEILKQITNG